MRQETTTCTIYKFAELSDEAQQAAIDGYRDGGLGYEWWNCAYDDFLRVADILGVATAHEKMQFTGFCSQGDGASFTGSYSYKKGALKKIKEYAPQEKTLHDIAQRLQSAQKKWFYRVQTEIGSLCWRYSHARTMSCNSQVPAQDQNGYMEPVDTQTDRVIEDAMRDLADWHYRRLEAEYDYLMSDEYAREVIQINEYEFTEDGTIH